MSRPTQIESMRLKEKWHAIIATAGAASRRITGRSGPTVSEPCGRATVVTLGKLPERGPGGQRATAGDQLLTVIVIPAEVVVWPAASRAMAVSVYVPFGTPYEVHAGVGFARVGERVVDAQGHRARRRRPHYHLRGDHDHGQQLISSGPTVSEPGGRATMACH